MARAAVIALSHGGGPLPLLNDPAHAPIAHSLRTRVPRILRLDSPDPSLRPRAIILVTAHWATRIPTISAGAAPKLYYDYSGFPPETYNYKYPAPGSPEVARELATALRAEGLEAQLDEKRGWDHGVFVPMMLIWPKADVPVVQMSVLDTEDAGEQFRVGRVLGKMRDSGVAVVASGFASFHNLRVMFGGGMGEEGFKGRNRDWNRKLDEGVKLEKVEERLEALKGWRGFVGGKEMHPPGGGEHFLPLLVAAGAGGEGKAQSYSDKFQGLDMYSWYWD